MFSRIINLLFFIVVRAPFDHRQPPTLVQKRIDGVRTDCECVYGNLSTTITDHPPGLANVPFEVIFNGKSRKVYRGVFFSDLRTFFGSR